MLRDAVLAGPTAAEIIALARLVEFPDAAPPPHLSHSLRDKGWIITTADGQYLLTLPGRTLVDNS